MAETFRSTVYVTVFFYCVLILNIIVVGPCNSNLTLTIFAISSCMVARSS